MYCCTRRRISGSKPMSSIRSASSSTRNFSASSDSCKYYNNSTKINRTTYKSFSDDMNKATGSGDNDFGSVAQLFDFRLKVGATVNDSGFDAGT